jgi:hypothetical protein
MGFGYGSPDPIPDTRYLIGLRWRLALPGDDAGAGCTADIVISSAAFE